MIMISSNLIFNFTNSCILFSTAVLAAEVAKLVVLGILFLAPFILALRAVVVAKLGISFFNFIHFSIKSSISS